MYGPRHTQSPSNVWATVRDKIEKLLFEKVNEGFTIIWDEILDLYRLYDDRPAGPKGGGGGDASKQIQAPIQQTQNTFVFQIDAEADMMSTPQKVKFRLWGDRERRKLDYLNSTASIVGIGGHIIIEGSEGIGYQYAVVLEKAFGSETLQGGMYIGYDIGFEKYDASRRKFYLDIFEFDKVALTDSTDTTGALTKSQINNIKVGSRKYRSKEFVLTEQQLTDYSAGNLRIKCQLNLFLQY